MRYKAYGQLSVLDELLAQQKRNRVGKVGFLEELDGFVDWSVYRERLEASFSQSASGPCRYDVLLLFKMSLLQQWYELSDPEVESQVADRLSFRRFLGLSVNDRVPDETTVCLFRKHLVETGLYDWLFETMQSDLERRHLLVKKGALLDATFIEAPRGKDRDASTGHKGHGYSVGVHVDSESKLIREVEVTGEAVHDSQQEEALLFGDEKSIWADKAYANDEKTRQARKAGVYRGVLDKAKRNRPLSLKQKRRNQKRARVRSSVEHPFAQMKEHQGYRRTRYRGLEKNRFHASAQVMAYNLRRMVFLLKRQAQQVVESLCCELSRETCALMR
jgi:IS5 family transposase